MFWQDYLSKSTLVGTRNLRTWHYTRTFWHHSRTTRGFTPTSFFLPFLFEVLAVKPVGISLLEAWPLSDSLVGDVIKDSTQILILNRRCAINIDSRLSQTRTLSRSTIHRNFLLMIMKTRSKHTIFFLWS